MTLSRLCLLAGAVLSSLSTVLSQVAPPTLTNPSFEADSFTNYPGLVSGNRPLTGWSVTANVGINPIADGRSPFADNGSIPQGGQVAFIGSGGSLRQLVTGFVP